MLSKTLLHFRFLGLQVFDLFFQSLEVGGVDTIVLWTESINKSTPNWQGPQTLLSNCAFRSCQRLLSLSRSVIWASRAWSSARATRACSLAGSSSAERVLSLESNSRERFEYVSQSARRVTLLSRRMLSWLIRSNSSACCASDVAAWTARSRS